MQRFSPAVFAVVFAGLYLLAFINGWTSFRHYPAGGIWTVQDLPRSAGPAMGWYAWIAQGFAGGVIVTIAALAAPASWRQRLGPSAAAIAIAILIAATLVVERHWFQGSQ